MNDGAARGRASGDTHPAEGSATGRASGDAHPAEGTATGRASVMEGAERASGDVLEDNITWLRESLAGEEDASRRSDAETLLTVASELRKQPAKKALRQIAKELQVHQKDRRMNELYEAVLARVRERVDELRKQSPEIPRPLKVGQGF